MAPVHRCVACALSWATSRLFIGVHARCAVLRVRCPGPLGFCSTVCTLGVSCCVCGVLGHLAPVHRCAPSVCCVCGVLGHLAPGYQCARSVCCVACAVSLATWLPFLGVPAWCVVLHVPCPWPLGLCSPLCTLDVLCVRCPCPLGSCSLACTLAVLCFVCSVISHLVHVHRCAHSVCCVESAVSLVTGLPFTSPHARCAVCAVSLVTLLLFTSVQVPYAVLCVRCPGPLGSCSPVCLLGLLYCVSGVFGNLRSRSPAYTFAVLCFVCDVLGHLAPVHRCARSLCCFACAVSLATWLLSNGLHARCAVCAVFLATWLLFIIVPARCVMLRVCYPWQLGSRSPACTFAVLCFVCDVLCHLVPVHRYARSACCVCVVLRRLAPVHRFAGLVCCVSSVLGHRAPVHRCARSVCSVLCVVSLAAWLSFNRVPALCAVCSMSLATWLLFTAVPARCLVLRVRCP